MYNRYIPRQVKYETASGGPPPASPSSRGVRGKLGSLLGGLNGGDGVSQGVSALLKTFHLDDLDAGDILLALIVLFLILEDGDDLDLIITLGLMILFTLGEK